MNTKSTLFLLLLSSILTVGHFYASAQTTSILGRFTVDVDHGCTGMTVNITQNEDPLEPFDGVRYYYEGYNGGAFSAEGTDLFYTYTTPGDYYLTLFINNEPKDGEPDSEFDSLLIRVVNPQIPDFVIHNCDAHRVRVEIAEDFYDAYRVDFTAIDSELVDPLSFSNEFNFGTQGSYRIDVTGILTDGVDNCGTDNRVINTINEIVTPVLSSIETTENGPSGAIQLVHSLGSDIVYNLNSATNGSIDLTLSSTITGPQTDLTDLSTNNDYFCFQIETYDACNEVVIPSNIVCSVLFDVQSSENGNLVSWTTDTTLTDSYNILRDDNLLINITPSNVVSFVDTAVICKRQYSYNVQPIFASGSSLAIDTTVVANQSGSLPAITKNPSSSVLSNQVVLEWGPPDTGEIPFRKYLIEKNINNRGWLSAGSTEDTTYTDRNASFVGSHSYRISYDDECGNIASGSPPTDPVIIQQVSARGRIVNYRWNRYETWLQGIRNYTLERVDSAGNLIEEFPVLSGREKSLAFEGNDLVDKYVRIRAESLDDTPKFSYSNIILTQLETEMYVPSGFTPDGDNLNDKFFAKGPSVFNFYMEIYNRWGVLVFGTNDNINGWDGTIRGEDSPEGTYIYKIYFEDGEGRRFDQSGAFTLLRQR